MKQLASILVILAFVLLAPTIFADNDATPSAKVQVTHIAGGLEKFREKTDLWFVFDPKKKLEILQNQLEKRMAEIEYVVTKNHFDYLEETSSRFSTSAGKLTNFQVQHKLRDQKQSTLDQFSRHQTMVKRFEESVEYGSGLWMLLEHDFNALGIYKNQINNL